MVILNEWLIFSLILFGIWLILLILKKGVRKEMLLASIITMLFGLTEPLFVPEYWNPPSLFNLAAKTGFDIESLIFSFAIGGIGAVLYEFIFKSKHVKMNRKEIHSRRHKYHLLSLISPIIVFAPLFIFTSLNPIYSASIAMLIGGISTMFCRPDLKKKIFFSGILFLCLYFLFFLSFNIIYPNAVDSFWNISALTGILILGVPLEELIFAFTFGMLWSSYYEHLKWFKLIKDE
ncbi:MAG: lycopene cyclase domain-containing protein [Nanoarchaeota archaeon]|nr:lycopene cyclase domain-containing protein [Nanoarchaeota archaeon]